MSGLPREAPCGIVCTNTNTTEQLRLLQDKSLIVEPGTYPSYSNLAYILLGRLLTERYRFSSRDHYNVFINEENLSYSFNSVCVMVNRFHYKFVYGAFARAFVHKHYSCVCPSMRVCVCVFVCEHV